jgi:NADPH-dependent F420 reductase
LRITIIGGTGDLGRGLAIRWARNHEVILGSRSPEKGVKVAEKYALIARQIHGKNLKGTVTGMGNPEAARKGEIVVFAVPFKSIVENMEPFKGVLSDRQIILSTVVPMKRIDRSFEYVPFMSTNTSTHKLNILSAAEIIANKLPPAGRVVSGLHTMSAKRLGELERRVECDIILCGDEPKVVEVIARIIKEIPGVRTFYAGPLRVSLLVESTTPLIVNIAKYSRKHEPLIRIV